jgi:hypothetical protein
MSISFDGNIVVSSVAFESGVTHEGNNEVNLVESTGPTFRRYSLSSLTQVGTSVTTLSAPSGVTLINSSSAVVCSSGNTQVDFIEISSGFRTNHTGALQTPSTPDKSQYIAVDSASNTVMYISTSTSPMKVVKVIPNQVISQIDIPAVFSASLRCIISKESGRFLLGDTIGHIYEMDVNGNILDNFILPIPNTEPTTNTGSAYSQLSIQSLAYSDNLLLATVGGSLNGMMYLIDWTTKTVLQIIQTEPGSNFNVLSNPASGVCLAGTQATTTANKPIHELDFTTNIPIHATSTLFTDSTGGIIACGINTTNNKAWALQESTDRIRVFTVTPRESTTRLITVQDGANVEARVILIDDTTAGASKIILDTYSLSPATYRVPSGKNIIEMVKYNDGVTAKWATSRYTS